MLFPTFRGIVGDMSLRYQNPVHPEYFADPFAWQHEGVYYAIGTAGGLPHAGEDARAEARVFPLLRSRNLVTWESLGHALVRPDPALGHTFWAPEVAFHDGRFYLYYSVGFEDKRHQLRVATSERPEGPYRDCGISLVEPETCPFAIDAHPFRDDDGCWYLFYARDFLDQEGGARPGTALMVQRLETMTRLGGKGHVCLRARYDWQRFQNQRPMYGGQYDWHTLEGPAVLKRDGRYYLFYSGGRWENESYGVDYAVADHILGPYVSEAPGGPRVLRTVPGRVLGPGHNSFVRSPGGGTDLIIYHAWDATMSARRLCLDPLVWTPNGPVGAGPTWEPREIHSEKMS